MTKLSCVSHVMLLQEKGRNDAQNGFQLPDRIIDNNELDSIGKRRCWICYLVRNGALCEVSTPIVHASINTVPNDYCAAGILQDNYHIGIIFN